MTMADPLAIEIEKDKSAKKLKRQVEGWREVILLVQSVLLWEQQWYPLVIFGASSTVSLLFWYLDPSILTAVSIVCLLITLLDTLVPTLSATFFNPANWTGAKERQFEEFCKTIIEYKTLTTSHWANLQAMKTTQPKLYYTIAIVSLCFLAWLGNWNNLLLSYIFVTSFLLTPGLVFHGYLQHYYRMVLLTIVGFLRGLSSEKVKTK